MSMKKENSAIRSIAILRLSALGDVCLTIPLVRSLQKHLPNTTIYWIIGRQYYSLVDNLSDVHFIVIDTPRSLKQYWECFRILKQFHFDVLLMPQDTLRAHLISLFISANRKYGYARSYGRACQYLFISHTVKSKHEHAIHSYLRFSEAIGITDKTIHWQLPISEKENQESQKILALHPGKWLAICLSSSKARKDWPYDRYLPLLQDLQKKWAFNVLLIGKYEPQWGPILTALKQQIQCPIIDLTGKTSLKQLTALLAQVDGLLSPDTGPVHIATALNTPVVGLYAVTSSEETGPYGSPWTLNKFPEAVRIFLKKDPAKLSSHPRVRSPQAMSLISIDEVKDQLNALFDSQGFDKKPAFTDDNP